jgi:predicted small lipoprotein YifL
VRRGALLLAVLLALAACGIKGEPEPPEPQRASAGVPAI